MAKVGSWYVIYLNIYEFLACVCYLLYFKINRVNYILGWQFPLKGISEVCTKQTQGLVNHQNKSMNTTTHPSIYHIKMKIRCRSQLPTQSTWIYSDSNDPSQEPELFGPGWNFLGRQFKTLASQITIRKIGLRGVLLNWKY